MTTRFGGNSTQFFEFLIWSSCQSQASVTRQCRCFLDPHQSPATHTHIHTTTDTLGLLTVSKLNVGLGRTCSIGYNLVMGESKNITTRNSDRNIAATWSPIWEIFFIHLQSSFKTTFTALCWISLSFFFSEFYLLGHEFWALPIVEAYSSPMHVGHLFLTGKQRENIAYHIKDGNCTYLLTKKYLCPGRKLKFELSGRDTRVHITRLTCAKSSSGRTWLQSILPPLT